MQAYHHASNVPTMKDDANVVVMATSQVVHSMQDGKIESREG